MVFELFESIMNQVESTLHDSACTPSHTQIDTIPNAVGGHDVLVNQHHEGQLNQNIFGGQEFNDHSGSNTASSQPNIFGGVDLHDHAGNVEGNTQSNIFSGQDIFDSHGQMVAQTRENIFGGCDVVDSLGQKIASSQPNIFGGLSVKLNK